MKRFLLPVLVLCACSKRQPPTETTGPAPTPSGASAPSGTATGAASAAPRLERTYLRLPVASATASSEYDKKTEKHLAIDAFDGNPWTVWSESKDGPGKGEWLEGKLAQKRRIKRVRVVGFDVRSKTAGDLFVENAHPKKITVTFDGGAAVTREIPETERATTIDLDVDAQVVKVTFDDVWEGKKWQDLSIAEVELYGELPIGIATVPEDIADRIKRLDEGGWRASSPDAPKLLASLGVPAQVLKPYPLARVDSARSFRAQLDRDSDQEGVAMVTLFNQAEVPHKTFAHTFFVLFDDDAHGRAVVGTRDVLTFRCLDKEARKEPPEAGRPPRIDNVDVKAQPVHAAEFSDLVVTWKSVTACDDTLKGEQGGFVLTLERGMAETLFEVREPFERGAVSAHELNLGGAPPKTIELVDGVKVDARFAFDATSFRYR